MLDSIRKGQRWLTLIFVSVIGLVFVFFFGVGGSFGPGQAPGGSAIIQLDDMRLTQRDFARARQETESRLRAELGDSYEQLDADRFVDSQALSSLINTVVLAASAEEMGLVVTREELRRVVQASPAFRDETGRFNPAAFDRFASYNYGSQRAFIRSFTRDLLGQKLVQLVVGNVEVSEAEVDLRARYELEEVRLAYVAVPTDELPADIELTEEEIEAYAAEHEEDLRALFAERLGDYIKPERVRARHLVILAPAEASAEQTAQARERAEQALARIRSDESFEEVAREISEDAGTAAEGGSLGVFARGENDPAIDEAAFALAEGEVSDVIRSAYGFHILQVDERLEASTPRFEDRRLDLARERLARERAREWTAEKSEALAEAIEAGRSLEEAARDEGLALERMPAQKRRPDGYVPGLGAAPEILATAFTLEAGESSSRIFELPEKRVLIQVLERHRPSGEELAAKRSTLRKRMEQEKQDYALQVWLNDTRRRLEQQGRLRINAELALDT